MKTRTLCIVALLAFAAGGTCPSDVNNDGVVGIQDFLQVLGAWGPCPNATVVDVAVVRITFFDSVDGRLVVRIWSDGFAEYRGMGQSINPQQWVPLPFNPDPPSSSPVGVSGALGLADSNNFRHCEFVRQWGDGYADSIVINAFDTGGQGWESEIISQWQELN